MLTEEFSAIFQGKLTPKIMDLGSFTLPWAIGNSYHARFLCYLGANVNLMPFSVFRKFWLGKPKPTTISLQFANWSTKCPRGIIKDVLLKVHKFIFPVDFIVFYMEEQVEISLILGRPFLATSGTLIDV